MKMVGEVGNKAITAPTVIVIEEHRHGWPFLEKAIANKLYQFSTRDFLYLQNQIFLDIAKI